MRKFVAVSGFVVGSVAGISGAQVSTPEGLILTGPDAGLPGQVNFYTPPASYQTSIFPYTTGFAGGVRVAAGDVNGDGITDVIVAPGEESGPHVRVFDGLSQGEICSFFAFPESFAGGVFVAAGDVTGDGLADVITGSGPGGAPHVKVFDGATCEEVRSFLAFDPAFTGGVRVAAGDVNGDGVDDIVVGAGPGAGPHVRVFNGSNTSDVLGEFFAYDLAFAGGVHVAAGDWNGDGTADIVTGSGATGAPHVKVFRGDTFATLESFFAYSLDFMGGVRVAMLEAQGASGPEILTGPGSGRAPQVNRFGTGAAFLGGFFPYEASFTGGVFVAAAAGVGEQSAVGDWALLE